MAVFDYNEAFSRNLGWITQYEQLKLKQTRVAIAGMGGVGGIYLLACVRMGIEKFNLSEFDTFELGNFNRQVGSSMLTVGRPKLEVMIEQARAINPNVDIRSFPEGIGQHNVEAFLADCDIYLDGIDFFETGVRRIIFKEIQRRGIIGITAAPAAMGCAVLTFAPGCPDFEEFFDFASYPKEYESLVFIVGLAPRALHRSSLFDASRIHFADRKVSSNMMGCHLCTGCVVTEAVKHILERGNRLVAPYGIHYDAHSQKFVKTCLLFGNKGPLQKLKIRLAAKDILEKSQYPYPYHNAYKDDEPLLPELREVLDLARWAPSGDNMQPFTVKIVSQDVVHVEVHKMEVYFQKYLKEDLSALSFGVYFETLRQAATLYGYDAKWKETKEPLTFEVSFKKKKVMVVEESAPYIRARYTDRRPYKTTPLRQDQIDTLTGQTLGQGYRLVYREEEESRLNFARHEMKALGMILSEPSSAENMAQHISFDNLFSLDKMPIESLGFSLLTRPFVKFFMKRPALMAMFSKLNLSLPVLYEYSYLPHKNCAGHFAIVRDGKNEAASEAARTIEDGQMIQRFWLKAASMGIALQPAYLQTAIAKSDGTCSVEENEKVYHQEKAIKGFVTSFLDQDPEHLVFMGRIGTPRDRKVYARSTRHKV
ncbi:MAG: ThiF family adenylyltransferase [Proteobacteria bacterium]|nr:ThiF family adenylyltransferase [Pseudomonadota bacterium]